MHGPLQIEMVAIVLRVLGDTDFVARLPYALFGVVLVALPYFLRRQIGDIGAFCAAVILTFSPSLLYFSRFGRNDILMVVWAVLLLIFLWRYREGSRRRYLLGAAAVTALMLATKETAYFVILFMGIAALGLGWRELWAVGRRKMALVDLRGAAGFFVLLATLTLPQAAAVISVVQGPVGLTFAAGDTGSTGDTGAPVWEEPFVTLPFWDAAIWMHGAGLIAMLGAFVVVAWFLWRVRAPLDLAAVCGGGYLRRGGGGGGRGGAGARDAAGPGHDGSVPGLRGGRRADAAGSGDGFRCAGRDTGWRRISLLLGLAAVFTWLWLAAFGGGLGLAGELLPAAAPVADLADGRIAVNYVVPVLTLLLLLVVGGAVGIAWGGGTWLLCAGVFYVIWATLYTTFFTNWPGVFTGAWQSLGYWLAQQEVARGNQPWYYYGVGLTVYESLALVFGLAAVIWLLRRREPFGIVLAAWVVATLAIYTIAAEKMPWLLVNMTAPLALAAGMLLGRLIDGIRWPLGTAEQRRMAVLLAAGTGVGNRRGLGGVAGGAGRRGISAGVAGRIGPVADSGGGRVAGEGAAGWREGGRTGHCRDCCWCSGPRRHFGRRTPTTTPSWRYWRTRRGRRIWLSRIRSYALERCRRAKMRRSKWTTTCGTRSSGT